MSFASLFRRAATPPPTVEKFWANSPLFNDKLDAKSYFSLCLDTGNVHCSDMLKFFIKDNTAENFLFLLMCHKYLEHPDVALFQAIYDDFIETAGYNFDTVATDHEANLPATTKTELRTSRTRLASMPATGMEFNTAIEEITALLKRDSIPRLRKAPIHTAFVLTQTEQTRYDDAIAFLARHGISLDRVTGVHAPTTRARGTSVAPIPMGSRPRSNAVAP